MTPLQAITLGYAVPRRNFTGAVHSVFTSAANLAVDGEEHLLTLLAGGETDLPQGIRTPALEGVSLVDELQAGQPFSSHDGRLSFTGAALAVDLRAARRWRCDLPALMADMDGPDTAAAWKHAWRVLRSHHGHEHKGLIAFSDVVLRPQVRQDAEDAVRALITAARGHALAVEPVLETLIGLGSGLTPSCDDVLAGFLAGLWCTLLDHPERIAYVDSLGRAILTRSPATNDISRSPATNDISRTYLAHAARGQVSSPMAALAEAIATGGGSASIAARLNHALALGHNSGAAAVNGLLLGLAAWDGDLEALP
jgi:hypothetical protein